MFRTDHIRTWVRLALALLAMAGAAAPAHAAGCTRADFEAVVSSASTTLRDMTARNTPEFQEKLRQLKDKRGWTYDQFVREAAPLVADDKITDFDTQSMGFLERINTMGGEGASGAKPDCALLDRLKAEMAALVETQTQKWAYMFGKIDAEMKK